jgi:hypothetical protein
VWRKGHRKRMCWRWGAENGAGGYQGVAIVLSHRGAELMRCIVPGGAAPSPLWGSLGCQGNGAGGYQGVAIAMSLIGL